MRVEFLDPASEELIEAIAHYNSESAGLGYRFAAGVKRTITRIVQHPQAWPILSERTRRCRTNGFPYGIVYQIREETVLLVAVMHFHRDPEYWRERLSS